MKKPLTATTKGWLTMKTVARSSLARRTTILLAAAATLTLIALMAPSHALADTVALRGATVTDVEIGKAYETVDVTGDGLTDRVKVKGVVGSACYDGYYLRFRVYVNGKRVLRTVKSWDERGMYPQVKLITLKNGKSLLYVHYSTVNGYYAGGWVYAFGTDSLTRIFKTEKLVNAFSSANPDAWRCYEMLSAVKANQLVFKVGSTTTNAAAKYRYRYKGGKLVEVA